MARAGKRFVRSGRRILQCLRNLCIFSKRKAFHSLKVFGQRPLWALLTINKRWCLPRCWRITIPVALSQPSGSKQKKKLVKGGGVPQGGGLGYLIEFDPASARPLVERAVQARGPGKTACNHSIFQDIAHYSQDPMLREVAIQTLDDPDPEVTMDALIYLMSYGDASDEEPISNRYTKWSHKWRGHSGELDSRQAGSPAGNWQGIGLGKNLARALIANQGWLASEKLIQNTIEKCVGEQMCQQLKQLADRARTTPYSISAYKQGENENYEIAQYSAKSLELLGVKIAQFPKGTRFIMADGNPEREEQKKLDGNIRNLLEQHGMVAENDPH